MVSSPHTFWVIVFFSVTASLMNHTMALGMFDCLSLVGFESDSFVLTTWLMVISVAWESDVNVFSVFWLRRYLTALAVFVLWKPVSFAPSLLCLSR
jgi:hypothetical protein